MLRLLRPAESAARRLVIVAARDIVVEFSPPRPRKPKPNPKSAFIRRPGGAGILMTRGLRNQADAARAAPRTLRLPLFDALRRPDRIRRPVRNSVPRISFPGLIEPSPIKLRRPPAPWDPIDATRLALRLAALGRALDDLPGHAKRFARWRTRKAAAMQDQETSRREGGRMRFPRLFPLRFGRPPGQRSRNSRLPEHEVHDVLADLQYFAHQAFPDTS